MFGSSSDNDQATGQEKKKGLGKFQMAAIGVIGLMILVGLFREDEPVTTPTSSSKDFDPDKARAEEQRQMAEREAKAKDGKESLTYEDGLDPLAGIAALNQRVEQLTSQLEDVQSEFERSEKDDELVAELKDKMSDLEGQIASIADFVKNKERNQREIDRESSRNLNQGGSDLAFDLEGGAPMSEIGSGSNSGSIDDLPDLGDDLSAGPVSTQPAHRSPYGDNYIVLRDTPAPIPPSTGTGFEISNPFGNSGSNADQSQSKPPAQEDSRKLTPEYRDSVEPGYADDEASKPAAEEKNDEEEVVDIVDVPAFAFVEAETLHGLSCPIGATLPTNNGDGSGSAPGATQPMPVVLPMRGKIRGPNGYMVDLGSAHLMGWCFGRRVDRGENGRAFIKVEGISYWDREGKPQYLSNISGDVISLVDNHRGIQAPIDEVKRSYMGDQAFAASLAAAAAGLNETQFQESKSEGDINRIMTGDQGVAYASKGVSALFGTIANLINEEANQAFDAVVVNPGAPVKILFMKPFTVNNHKTDVEGDLLDAYEVLI